MTTSQELTKLDYPEHECPPALERGESRSAYHGPEGGSILFATYRQTECGCTVVGNGTLQHPLMVEPCDAHRAAMYPRLAPVPA